MSEGTPNNNPPPTNPAANPTSNNANANANANGLPFTVNFAWDAKGKNLVILLVALFVTFLTLGLSLDTGDSPTAWDKSEFSSTSGTGAGTITTTVNFYLFPANIRACSGVSGRSFCLSFSYTGFLDNFSSTNEFSDAVKSCDRVGKAIQALLALALFALISSFIGIVFVFFKRDSPRNALIVKVTLISCFFAAAMGIICVIIWGAGCHKKVNDLASGAFSFSLVGGFAACIIGLLFAIGTGVFVLVTSGRKALV